MYSSNEIEKFTKGVVYSSNLEQFFLKRLRLKMRNFWIKCRTCSVDKRNEETWRIL